MDVLAKLDANRCNPAVETQRRFRRYNIRSDARLEALDERATDESILINLRDISSGGIGFLVSRFIEPLTCWRVRFLIHDRVFASQPVSVRFCRLVEAGLYLVGAQFIIEPYVMSLLGVPEDRLRGDDLGPSDNKDLGEFLAPDSAR
jgi:hypothetical protein